MAIPKLAVEPEFDAIVTAAGGDLVSSLIGKSPPFDNADYIFHDYKLVAELKCVQEDKANDPTTRAKFRRLWIKWRQRRLVSGSVPSSFNSRSLPAVC